MLFKIHYFVFNAGLSGVLPLITVFLRKYSDASPAEVGTLLMVLPFLAVLAKPFFCALADRHRQYRLYFLLAILATLLGFGLFPVLPMFPRLVEREGRLCWHLLLAATVLGYLAYGVVWSLGDAYAANVAYKTGESFGLIRLWGTVGWGVAGAVVALLSPHLSLPEMVLGFLLFVGSHLLLLGLIWWWPNAADFEMGAARPEAHSTEAPPTPRATMHRKPQPEPGAERARIAALQTTIFRLVARQHKSIFKYLLLYALMGATFNMHWSYFFLHIERLAQEGQVSSFAGLVGLCLVAQAVGETYCFVQAPRVVARLGCDGAISLNLATYVLRYLANGLGIPLVSPFVAVLTESLQGINYGIFYYLLSDTALHFALRVDDVIPELKRRHLLGPHSDLDLVRTSLRATMQGVFSAAFDGLGFGLGSLAAGLLLERFTYEQVWCLGGVASALFWLLHALYELCLAGAGKRRPFAGDGAQKTSHHQLEEELELERRRLAKKLGQHPATGELAAVVAV